MHAFRKDMLWTANPPLLNLNYFLRNTAITHIYTRIRSGKIAASNVLIQHVFANFILFINQIACAECVIEFECKIDISN